MGVGLFADEKTEAADCATATWLGRGAVQTQTHILGLLRGADPIFHVSPFLHNLPSRVSPHSVSSGVGAWLLEGPRLKFRSPKTEGGNYSFLTRVPAQPMWTSSSPLTHRVLKYTKKKANSLGIVISWKKSLGKMYQFLLLKVPSDTTLNERSQIQQATYSTMPFM